MRDAVRAIIETVKMETDKRKKKGRCSDNGYKEMAEKQTKEENCVRFFFKEVGKKIIDNVKQQGSC